MRECGQKRAFWARLGLGGSVVFLFAGVIAVSSHSTVTDAPNWTRALSDLIVAPAHADRDDRRSRRKGSGDDRQAETALRRAQQEIQQTEAARKRLQEAGVAQKRIQQMQEAAAAAQKRIQQHRYQPAAPQASSNVQLVAPRQSVADRHRVALEETMAKLRGRHSAPRQETLRPETLRQTAGSRHQAVLTQVMTKLRAHSPVSRNSARHDDRSSRDGFGGGHGRQPALQSAMDRLRARHADRNNDRFDRGRSEHGQHVSRQQAVYSHILTKFSRHGRRSREAKQEVVAAPPPVVVITRIKTTTSKATGILPDAPDIRTLATTISSKLPDVVVASTTTSADGTMPDTAMRLGGPRQPAADDRSSSKSKTKKDDDADAGDGGSGKPAGRNLGRRVVNDLLPPPGTFRQNEVLAVNLKAAGLARALQRNFKVIEKVEYPRTGFQSDPSCNSRHPKRHHRTQYLVRRAAVRGLRIESYLCCRAHERNGSQRWR